MYLKPLLILIAVGCLTVSAWSQDNPDVVDKITNFPSSFFNKVNKKTASVEDKLTPQTEKYLERLAKRKKKLQRKRSKVNSNAAKQLFANSAQAQLNTLTGNAANKIQSIIFKITVITINQT
jgi:hypothetical protein